MGLSGSKQRIPRRNHDPGCKQLASGPSARAPGHDLLISAIYPNENACYLDTSHYPENTYALVNQSILFVRQNNKWIRMGESQITKSEYERFIKQVKQEELQNNEPSAPPYFEIYSHHETQKEGVNYSENKNIFYADV